MCGGSGGSGSCGGSGGCGGCGGGDNSIEREETLGVVVLWCLYNRQNFYIRCCGIGGDDEVVYANDSDDMQRTNNDECDYNAETMRVSSEMRQG